MVSRSEWDEWRDRFTRLRALAREVVAMTRNERHHGVLRRALAKKRAHVLPENPELRRDRLTK
jgi:hypothetical protein